MISYSRKDIDTVKGLAAGLDAAYLEVWFDVDLRGGEPWWSQIMKNIRACDVFIFALSDTSVASKPCLAELEYAKALNRPIVPVQVGPVSSLAATPFGPVEIKPYRSDDAATSFAVLAAIISAAQSAPPLPVPLPPEQPIPFKYLMAIANQIDVDEMSINQQLDVVNQLRKALLVENDDGIRTDIDKILNNLKSKPWVMQVTVQQIEQIQRGQVSTSTDRSTGTPPSRNPPEGAGNDTVTGNESIPPPDHSDYFENDDEPDRRRDIFVKSFPQSHGAPGPTPTENQRFQEPVVPPPPASWFDNEQAQSPQPSPPLGGRVPPGPYGAPQQPYMAAPQQPYMAGGYPHPGGYPPAAGQYPPGEPVQSLPSPNWPLTIIGLIMCFIPGLVAVIYSGQVSEKLRVGDFIGAQKASNVAKGWAISAIVVGALVIIVIAGGA